MNKSEHTKKHLIDALESSLGIVTTACKRVGVGRTIFYKYYNEDPAFKAEVDEIQNMALDFAESKLHELIANGNAPATIFYLKTKGRNRGYVERHEITGAEGNKLDIQVEIIKGQI